MGLPLHPNNSKGLDNATGGASAQLSAPPPAPSQLSVTPPAPAQLPVAPPAPAQGLPFFPTLSREDATINGFPGAFPVDMPAGGYQNPVVSNAAHEDFIRAPPPTRISSPILTASAFVGTFPIGMSASGDRVSFVSNDPEHGDLIHAPPPTRISSPVSTARASANTSASVVNWEHRYNTVNWALSRRTEERDYAHSHIQRLNRELRHQRLEIAARDRDLDEAQADFARAAELVHIYHERLRWMETPLPQQDRELTAANRRIAALLSQRGELVAANHRIAARLSQQDRELATANQRIAVLLRRQDRELTAANERIAALLLQHDSELTAMNERIAALVEENTQHFNEMVDAQLEVRRLERRREKETREREMTASALEKLLVDWHLGKERHIKRVMQSVVSEPLRGNEKDAEEDDADVEEDSEETTEEDSEETAEPDSEETTEGDSEGTPEEDSKETTEEDEAISSKYVDLGPDGARSE